MSYKGGAINIAWQGEMAAAYLLMEAWNNHSGGVDGVVAKTKQYKKNPCWITFLSKVHFVFSASGGSNNQ